MPPKRAAKSKQVATRGRSKSPGRATPKSRSRTPSRSRSRSRVIPTSKRSRTPASESKTRRRRSPSSSSSASESPPRPPATRGRVPDTSDDKRGRISTVRATTPTRVSQRIIHKVEASRQHLSVSTRSLSPVPQTEKSNRVVTAYHKIETLLEEKLFPQSLRALFGVVTFLPLFYYLNFLVFTPAHTASTSATQVPHTLWGPAYRFAGVLWPTDWRIYFDYRCHLFVLLYYFLHILIARFVPFGYSSNNNSEARRTGYKANGLFALVFFGTIFAVAQSGKLPQLDGLRPSMMIPKYWLGLLAATGNIATLASLVVLVASRRLPRSQCSVAGNTGNFIVDFWLGRPVRPRWFGVDWKMFMNRPPVIVLLLAEVTYLCAQWERYGRVSPALALLVGVHSIWLIDAIIFESTLLTSYEVRHAGFGYYSLGGVMLFPYIYALPAAYTMSRPDVGLLFTSNGLPIYRHWTVDILAVCLFLVGYWIYRSSNNQKHLFRTQPNHPTFADMSKISGPHTQRLLAGGWWGFVRHPNYLGDLLMAYSASLPSGFTSAIPWMYPLLLTFILISRAREVEKISVGKYGISWTMYTKLVPYKFIPRIY